MITDLDGNANEFLIPKEKSVLVHDGQVVNKGELIVDGPADPQDILRLLGIEALARYIVDEVQDGPVEEEHVLVTLGRSMSKMFAPGEEPAPN